MFVNTRYRGILLALTVLMASSLACNMFAGGGRSTPTPEPIPVTTQAVEELQEELESAAEEAQQNDTVTIEITEAQLTSLLALELQSQQEPAIENPQVYLRDGQVQLFGNVKQSGITLPLKVVATVSVDSQGKPQYEVVSADLGPLPLPQSILDQLSAELDKALENQFNPDQHDMVIEKITIANGTMTIIGHRK